MFTIRPTTTFKKDMKRIQKRGLDTDKIKTVICLLSTGQKLPSHYKDHSLTGDWKHHRECHIEPDWLLIYYFTDIQLVLVRTGTHSDLF